MSYLQRPSECLRALVQIKLDCWYEKFLYHLIQSSCIVSHVSDKINLYLQLMPCRLKIRIEKNYYYPAMPTERRNLLVKLAKCDIKAISNYISLKEL